MRKVILLLTFFITAHLTLTFIFIVLLILYPPSTLRASHNKTIAYAALPTAQNVLGASITEHDGRTEKVRQFFAKHSSPLEPYAQDVIDASEKYGLDYRLIPAIAMIESTLCRTIPDNSYNCWGFGIYGKTVTHFSDYKEGIYTVTKALAIRYKKKGLHTPEEIMTMYTPSNDGKWARDVNYILKQLQ